MRLKQPSLSSNTTTSSSNTSSSGTYTPTTRTLTLNSAASARTFGMWTLYYENNIIVILFSARYLRVLEIIHEALVTSVVISKRDIYYRDVALFGTQSVVDKVSIPSLWLLLILILTNIDYRRSFMFLQCSSIQSQCGKLPAFFQDDA